MENIPEDMAGTVVRGSWIKYQKRWLALVVRDLENIPEEMAGTVVRGPWIKYQKRWLALVVRGYGKYTRRDGWHCGEGSMDKIPQERVGSWHCGEGLIDKIPEERAGTVVRCP